MQSPQTPLAREEPVSLADLNDSDDGENENDDAYMEAEDEAEAGQQPCYRCLFCDHVELQGSPDRLIGQHLVEAHNLRLGEFLAEQGFREQEDWVSLVAFMRAQQQVGGDAAGPMAALQAFAIAWREEKMRRRRLRVAMEDGLGLEDPTLGGASTGWPELVDDPLMYEADIDDLLSNCAATSSNSNNKDPASADGAADKDLQLRETREEISSLREQLAGMSALLRRLVGADGDAADKADCCQRPVPSAVAEVAEEDDQYYVDSYGGAGIHAEMLLDRVRTGAYHSFIAGNPALFAGRHVLDVGCGTGILSMFAARCGARVTAVDCAEVIQEAIAAAADNGLSDRIRFLRGKLETLGELSGTKVDAIISEWMGYFLLYEGMIESVIYARDQFLSPGGAVYPRICTLRLCGLDSPALYTRRVAYFDDIFGVKIAYLRERGLAEAHVEFDLNSDWVATDAPLLREFDLLTARNEDTRFSERVCLTASRDCTLHALAGYFDVSFLGDDGGGDAAGRNVTFSTGLAAGGGEESGTHWGQTVFCLRRPLQLARGESVSVGVSVGQPEGHPRGLRVTIDLPDGTGSSYAMK